MKNSKLNKVLETTKMILILTLLFPVMIIAAVVITIIGFINDEIVD